MESDKSSKIKSITPLIGAMTALLTSIASLIHARKEPAAEASYEILAKAVKENSEAIAKQHDDLIILRGYISGHLKEELKSEEQAKFNLDLLMTPVKPAASTSASTSLKTQPAVHAPAPTSIPSLSPRPVIFDPPKFSNLK